MNKIMCWLLGHEWDSVKYDIITKTEYISVGFINLKAEVTRQQKTYTCCRCKAVKVEEGKVIEQKLADDFAKLLRDKL